jgi:hypothetical protein
MEAIGFLGGQNLYYLYTAIGLLADSYYRGNYDAAFATRMAGNISLSSHRAKEEFNKLLESGLLSKSDADLVKEIEEAYDRIINESDAFVNSVEVNNDETVSRFNKYKENAWKKISSIWSPSD